MNTKDTKQSTTTHTKHVDGELRHGDVVTFIIDGDWFEGKVIDSGYGLFLRFFFQRNDAVFTKLGLDKYEFCEKHYGYEPMFGHWPYTKPGHYAGLKRVVNALYEEIEKGGAK